MIDLHSHTDESDGTCSPRELIERAARVGVTSLAITDHDTFAGHDRALPAARDLGIDLLCGIELSTKLQGHSVHLLGYFPEDPAIPEFRSRILALQSARRDRNVRLVARLRELGVDVTLEEVEQRGRGMTGRPHFARLLMEKGYVSSLQQAFDEYLGESKRAYVDRQEPAFEEGVRWIREAGGVASLAHPVRVPGDVPAMLPSLREMGLNAIEVFHSDHDQAATELYLALSSRYGLLATGGSDFHGANKPGIELGTGRGGNVRVPADVVKRLRERRDEPRV